MKSNNKRPLMSPKQQKEQSVQEIIKVDPRVRRTRRMLEQAMNELLKEKDFPDINVQDITARAELNRGTFYKHFLDKDDLLNTTIRERFQRMLGDKLVEPSALTASNLNVLIQTVYACMTACRSTCQTVRVRNEHSVLMNQMQQQIYALLLSWLQGVRTRPSLERQSPETTALAVSWMICGPLMHLVWNASETSKQDGVRQLTTLVHSALEDYWIEN